MRATPTKPLPAILTAMFAVFCMYCLPTLLGYGATACYYGLNYETDPKNVQVDRKPENCDYDWAPVGKKGCHYERGVYTSTDGKQPVFVHVYWDRVEDNQ